MRGREITGTAGDDIIRGTNGDDTINGDPPRSAPGGNLGGNDVIFGEGGNDTINADFVFFAGNDTVFGGRGDDTINLGNGADVVDGGKGDDVIEVTLGAPLVPFIPRDGTDTVLFNYSGAGNSFGHDTLTKVMGEDELVFLDKSGKTESVDDLAAQTRFTDVGENAYKIEWLKGDQSVTVHLDNSELNFFQPPENQVNWDDFTSLQELAQVVDFRFDYDHA